jgi:DNA-binding GntR family transcriptional regulator
MRMELAHVDLTIDWTFCEWYFNNFPSSCRWGGQDGTMHEQRLDDSVTLAEIVVLELRRAIVDGSLRPGARLHVQNISQRLFVSPASVRAVFPILASQGLIEQRPGRTPRVSSFDRAAVTASIALGVLMRGVVTQAVPRLGGPALRQALRVISRSLELVLHPDDDDPRSVAIEGYLEWASLSPNRALGELLAARSPALALQSLNRGAPGSSAAMLRAHHELQAAVEHGEGWTARRAIEALHGMRPAADLTA